MPFIGKVEYGRWLTKITIPWLEISGPGAVAGGDSEVIVTNNLRKHSTESGFGHIASSITYTALQSTDQKFTLDVGANVKFATASVQKGLRLAAMITLYSSTLTKHSATNLLTNLLC